MILDKEINLQINGYNLNFYKENYPDIKKGDVLKISQLDLSPRSTLSVECACSNECGEFYTRKRRDITNINTYCSSKCKGEHITSQNLIKHKSNILGDIKKRIESGQSILYADLKKEEPSLLFKIDKYYPLGDILQDLGYTEQEAIDNFGFSRNINKHTLSEQEIYDRLKYLKSINRLTTSAMRTEFEDLRLEQSIKKIYGSVENCFEMLGFERDIYHMDSSVEMGRKFENLFKFILQDLEIGFQYQKQLPNNKIPDFFISKTNIIIDTKLSTWTTSIFDDVNNYKDYCNSLIFVYLREGSTIPNYGEKVHFKSVYDYIGKLSPKGKKYYINELNKILSLSSAP